LSTGTTGTRRTGWAGPSVAAGLAVIATVLVIGLFLWVDTGSPAPVVAAGSTLPATRAAVATSAGQTAVPTQSTPVDAGGSSLTSTAALTPPSTTGPVGSSKGGAARAAVDPQLAAKALKVLQAVDGTGKPPKGYQGGRAFQNDGRGGTALLPRRQLGGGVVTYLEYDVNPYRPGVNRGPQRLVLGSDRSAYVTGDHYVSWWQLR